MTRARKVAAKKGQETKKRNVAAKKAMQQQEQQQQQQQKSNKVQTVDHPVAIDIKSEPADSIAWPPGQTLEEDRRHLAKRLYTPIEDWQTRIIRLHAGSGSDNLQLDVVVAAITEAPGVGLISEPGRVQYEALSYAWGDNTSTHSVTCNGISFTVTANLHEALVHLRKKDGIRFLWVDALCINQYDLEEKARQIQKLHTLFKRAEQVVVWLGQEAIYTQLAMTWMHSFCLHHESGCDSVGSVTRLAWLCDLNILLEGLTDLLKRPWIRRVWILQEMYSAQSVVVRCGPSQIVWNIFKRLSHCRKWVVGMTKDLATISKEPGVLDELTGGKNDTACDHDLIEGHRCMDVLAELTASPSISSDHDDMFFGLGCFKDLLYLLKETYMFQATDERDKVYALLGIAGIIGVSSSTEKIDGSPCFVIDYRSSMTEERLHRRLLQTFASKIRDFTFLDHWTHREGSSTCPTWQPIEFPCTDIFRQLSCVADQWASNGAYSRKPKLQHSIADESFLRNGGLVLHGRKLETISNITRNESSPAHSTADGVGLCYVKTERISALDEVDRVLDKMDKSDDVCKALRQILHKSWWSWELPASARLGDTLVHCKGVRIPKILRRGLEEEYKFVGSAKLMVKHPALDLISQRRVSQGVQEFWSKWLDRYKGNLHKFVIR
jgi:hypothetical protein